MINDQMEGIHNQMEAGNTEVVRNQSEEGEPQPLAIVFPKEVE